MPIDDVATVIEPGAVLFIDSSAALAYLTGTERSSPVAQRVLDAFVATGRNPAALSTVTVGEILVRPFRTGPSAVAIAEGFLRYFADIRVVPIDYEIARDAARIRARTGLAMPDALIVASALVSDSDILITNDRAWRGAIEAVAPRMRLCQLDTFVED